MVKPLDSGNAATLNATAREQTVADNVSITNSNMVEATRYYDNKDLEEQDEMDFIDRNLSRAMSQTSQASLHEIVQRLSVSQENLPASLNYDPENLNLRVLLSTIRHQLHQNDLGNAVTGVTVRNLTSLGVDSSATYGPSMSEIGYAIAGIPGKILGRDKSSPKEYRQIIRDVSGIVRSGEMVLVLGRPGAGCSTFLKTVAGEVDELVDYKGEIRYDGVILEEMLENFKSEVIYNPECEFYFFLLLCG